jgi:hypothetical protein
VYLQKNTTRNIRAQKDLGLRFESELIKGFIKINNLLALTQLNFGCIITADKETPKYALQGSISTHEEKDDFPIVGVGAFAGGLDPQSLK